MSLVYKGIIWKKDYIRDDTGLGEFSIVGHNSDTTSYTCGEYRKTERLPSGAVKRIMRTWCLDPDCPVCFQAWASMEAKKKSWMIWDQMSKVWEYLDEYTGKRLYHIVVSLDPEIHEREIYSVKWMRHDMKLISKLFCKSVGKLKTGGVFVTFHPGRIKKGLKGWQWGPHFHIITNCNINPENSHFYREYLEDKGIYCIVRNVCIPDLRESKKEQEKTKERYPNGYIESEDDLCKIIKYELSHCFSLQQKGKRHHFSYGLFYNNRHNLFKKIDDKKPWVIEEKRQNSNEIYLINKLGKDEIKKLNEDDVIQLYDEDEYQGDLDKLLKTNQLEYCYFTIGERSMIQTPDGLYPEFGFDLIYRANYKLKNSVKKRLEKYKKFF